MLIRERSEYASNPHTLPPIAPTAVTRYVAVLDVLGMKRWLENEPPEHIASKLYSGLAEAELGGCGHVREGDQVFPFGPLIGSILFSDTVVLYSVDDSWLSLDVLLRSVGSLLFSAFEVGIPLRGAISVGPTVIDKRRSLNIGPPFARAHWWAEDKNGCAYKGMGVSIEPHALARIREKLANEPPPTYVHFDRRVIERTVEMGPALIWHSDALFVKHGAPLTIAVWMPKHFAEMQRRFLERFHRRSLPQDARVMELEQLSYGFLLGVVEMGRREMAERVSASDAHTAALYRHKYENGPDPGPAPRDGDTLADDADGRTAALFALSEIGLRDGAARRLVPADGERGVRFIVEYA